MNELINLSSLISHVSVRGCSFVTRKVAFWSQFHPLFAQTLKHPCGCEYPERATAHICCPMSCPRCGNIWGAGITEGNSPSPLWKAPLPKQSVRSCSASLSWMKPNSPKHSGVATLKSFSVSEKAPVDFDGLYAICHVNAAWHEVPFFCPCFAQTGGLWCLQLAGIWGVRGEKGSFLCL